MSISSSATGLKPGVCTSTTRPTNPYLGQIIFETDTNLMKYWDGSTWVNANVSTIAGTTNQVVVSTSNGNVVVSLPSSVTISGALNANTGGADGGLSLRSWTANAALQSLVTTNMTGSEYLVISNGESAYFGSGTGGTTYLRGPANSSSHELRINSSAATFGGYVLKPANPSFTAHAISQTFVAPGYVVPTTVVTNIGSCYNTANGRFTAPIGGNYFFIFSGFKETTSAAPTSYWFYKNGGLFNGGLRAYQDAGGYAAVGPVQAVVTMAVGDYMQVYLSNGGLHGNQNCMYAGFLIG